MARPRKTLTRASAEQATRLVGLYAVRGKPRAIDPSDLVAGRVKLRRDEVLVCRPVIGGVVDERVNAFRTVLAYLDEHRQQAYGRFAPVAQPSDEEFEVWRRHKRGWSFGRIAREAHDLLGPMNSGREDRIDSRTALAKRAVRRVEHYLSTEQGRALQMIPAFRLARKSGFKGFSS